MINQTEKVSYVVNQIALENRKSEIEKKQNLDEFRTESNGVGVLRSILILTAEMSSALVACSDNGKDDDATEF